MKDDIDIILKKETENDERYDWKSVKIDKNGNVTLMELCPDNVKKVEAMLRYNSAYAQFSLEDNKLEDLFKEIEPELKSIKQDREKIIANDKKYKYSSTHYIKIFKYLYDNKKTTELRKYYTDLIYIILRKINSENRTRVSLKEIDTISDEIFKKFGKDKINAFVKALKYPCKNVESSEQEYELIKIISDKYENDDKTGKNNFSLATKFCHFFSFYLFNEGKYRDGFSIYDRVVKENLKYYYDYYVKTKKPAASIKKPYDADKKNNEYTLVDIYKNYQSNIDEILSSLDDKISRNGFDHIVWYTNKGQSK